MSTPEDRRPFGLEWVLERIDSQLTQINSKLDSKASQAYVERLERDLEEKDKQLDERLEKLEKSETARDAIATAGSATFSKREKVIGLTVASLAVVLQIVLLLAHTGGHW